MSELLSRYCGGCETGIGNRQDGTDLEFVTEARRLFHALDPASVLQVIRTELPASQRSTSQLLESVFPYRIWRTVLFHHCSQRETRPLVPNRERWRANARGGGTRAIPPDRRLGRHHCHAGDCRDVIDSGRSRCHEDRRVSPAIPRGTTVQRRSSSTGRRQHIGDS